MPSWRALTAAAAMAAGGALVFGQTTAAPATSSTTVVVEPQRDAPPHGPSAPSAGVAASAEQTVTVGVIGGGLELATPAATVVLERVDGSDRDWSGPLPAVRVVDARGTHEGWTVEWRLAAVELDGSPTTAPRGARVILEPQDARVVHGLAGGLGVGPGGPAQSNDSVLFTARPGGGGGTYEAGAMVRVRLSAPRSAEQVVVRLQFTID